MKHPPITYTRTPDGYFISHLVHGDGPSEIVFMHNMFAPLDTRWEHPAQVRVLGFMGSLGRCAMFDPRGTGYSDPVPLDRVSDPDDGVVDALAVMDAVGFESPAVWADGAACFAAATLAVKHPDRVRCLVFTSPALGDAVSPAFIESLVEMVETSWGTGAFVSAMHSMGRDPSFMDIYQQLERRAASPSTAVAVLRNTWRIDVRDVLPRITQPTLVVWSGDIPTLPRSFSEEFASLIPEARFLAIDSETPWNTDTELGPAVIELLGGERSAERVLGTLLYTDVVGSTDRAVKVGDDRWKDTLRSLDTFVGAMVDRFGGSLVKHMGDGHLATFSVPSQGVRAGLAIATGVQEYDLKVRVGLHTGEYEIRPDGDLAGLALHAAARINAEAQGDEVLVSRTVAELSAGSGIAFAERGTRELRGVPGEWQLYAASSDDAVGP